MRKFLVVALISLFVMEIAGVVFAGGPKLDYAGDVAGMENGRSQTSPFRTFRLVHFGDMNDSRTGLAAGTAVVWETSYDTGVSVQRSSTSGDSRVAGILVTATESADADRTLSYYLPSDDAGITKCWGWLQTYGPCTATCNGVSAITAGHAVTSIGGQVSSYFSNDASMRKMGKLGFAMDSATAGSEVEIFLNVK